MIKKDYILNSPTGLSSRISSTIVSHANRFNCDITLIYDNEKANLKSIMNVMAMIIRNNEPFSIIFDGVDEISASDFFNNYFVTQGIIR